MSLIGQEHVGPYLKNQIFFQICELSRNISNNTKFHLDQIPEKLMTKFCNTLKKNLFLAHFPIFGPKKYFSKNPVLSSTSPYRPPTLCKVSGKTNPIPRKLPEGWKDRP